MRAEREYWKDIYLIKSTRFERIPEVHCLRKMAVLVRSHVNNQPYMFNLKKLIRLTWFLSNRKGTFEPSLLYLTQWKAQFFFPTTNCIIWVIINQLKCFQFLFLDVGSALCSCYIWYWPYPKRQRRSSRGWRNVTGNDQVKVI